MVIRTLALTAALSLGQVDDTLDNTQCSPNDVAIHPAEKTVVEHLHKAGATPSVNRHGRLLYLYGARVEFPSGTQLQGDSRQCSYSSSD